MKKSTRETTPMPSKKKQVKVRKGKVSEIPSERLKKCFAAGNVIALFAVLKDWPLEELKAAGEDLQLFHDVAVKGIEATADKFAKKYIKQRGKVTKASTAFVAEEKDKAICKLDIVCAEIMSVIVYYMTERKAGQ